jgi:hypothetical protein
MLHRSIALAARGANSQLLALEGGMDCEPSGSLNSQHIGTTPLSGMARLLLSNEHELLPTE